MPSPNNWIKLAKNIYGDKLIAKERYSFSPDSLNLEDLYNKINEHEYKQQLEKIDIQTAKIMADHQLNKYHFINYDSINEFMERGFGFSIKIDGEIAAACTTVLVCEKGVEINIITLPEYRQMGLATLVASKFLIHCLENNLYPNWDASNRKSVGLAKKLGLSYTSAYTVFVLQ